MKEAEELLEKYNKGIATKDEIVLVESWYLHYKREDVQLSHEQIEEDYKIGLADLSKRMDINPVRLWPRIAAAASVLLIFSFGIYYLAEKHPAPQTAQYQKQDIAPGTNKATLTLADGSKIILTNTLSGKLAQQGMTAIRINSANAITYTSLAAAYKKNAPTVYNTAATPRGGQFQFVLSDGTRVWLNSASSIKYPVEFVGNDRQVELTGEAYFEVAHNAEKPFKVVSKGQTVEVLGTHFNISSYSDEEATKTTLLVGSVKVTSPGGNNMLKPGEQAQLKNSKLTITSVDPEEAVAWKNGIFNFKDDNTEAVMRKLARWYDVDIKYEGKIPARLFSGEISKNINASQILDILSFKKIHFKIEGKYIIVTP